MKYSEDYEVVIGLEVHVELSTETKIFCGCPTGVGGEPNRRVCPVCLGFPGTLPVLNEKVVTYAVKAGLALNCEITMIGKQDRKNYFYPDLPKAYQISQSDLPIGLNGHLDIETSSGTKRIGITRLHIEEDAGKLIHEGTSGTLIDYNRGGVPLIEIVSEPDFRSAEEVKAYLQKLRATLLYLGVSSCKMNEGAFRCDVNLSVRRVGETAFGTRTEMKNLNSFSFIMKAIENEAQRQINVLNSGGAIKQETRRWDAEKGQSTAMRSKEDAHDYRYFPDPDLMPIVLSAETLEQLRAEMPRLPEDYKKTFVNQYGLKSSTAEQLVSTKSIADYFISCAAVSNQYEIIANLIVTEGFRLLSGQEDEMEIPVSTHAICELAQLIGDNKLPIGIAKRVFSETWRSGKSPLTIIEEGDLWPISDWNVLLKIGMEVMTKMPQIKTDYLGGKTQSMGAFMGQMMKLTNGKADPKITEEVFKTLISN